VLSFIIPCFNEEALLGHCIESIRAELASTAIEIIVVDNGSTDMTAEVARLYGARVVFEPDKGVVRARQAGFMAAHGELLAFIDADSQLPPGWLLQVARIMINPKVVACSGPLVFNHLGLCKRAMTAAFYTLGVAVSRFLPMVQGGNCVVTRRALQAAGGFDTSIEFYGEDTATAIRLAKIGKVRMVPGMFVWSSSRRMDAEGFIRVGLRYMANYFWMAVMGRVWSKDYRDIRK
jgi:glycosyltransferase involved in cell wall biosynthesis